MNALEKSHTLKISLIMMARMLGLFMIFPVFSVYAQSYTNSTPLLIGVAIGIYGLSQMIMQIPFGLLSDYFGRKPLIVIGLIIFFIGSVITAIATDITTIIIGRALQGMGAIASVLMALLADVIREEKLSQANAYVGLQIGIAFVLALFFGPIISSYIGLSGLFWVIALLALIALAIVYFLPNQNINKHYKFNVETLKSTFNKSLMKFNYGIFTIHIILTSCFVVLPISIVTNSILTIEESWKLYLPVMLLAFLLMLPLIIAAEKYKKFKQTLLVSTFVLIISLFLLYKYSYSYTLMLVNLTLFFTAFNSLEALLPSLVSRSIHKSKKGIALGIFSSFQFFGAFIGGVLGGVIYHTFGLNSVFLLAIFVAILWLIAILTIQIELYN